MTATVEVGAASVEEAAFSFDDNPSSPPKNDEDDPGGADSVRAYLREISRTSLLNAAEEVALSKRIEAGVYAE